MNNFTASMWCTSLHGTCVYPIMSSAVYASNISMILLGMASVLLLVLAMCRTTSVRMGRWSHARKNRLCAFDEAA